MRFVSALSKSRASKASPSSARCCCRTCSKRWRNSSTLISSWRQNTDTGQKDGASAHHVGGAWMVATVVLLRWTMYCSSPKKANGMISSPRITVAIQPEVLSRSFCSMGT